LIRQLKSDELLEAILDAIQAGGWSCTVNQGKELPFRITITNGIDTQHLAIYIWNVGTGGKGRSRDEYRIQLKGEPPLLTGSAFKTLLLGWFESGKAFVAFDAYKHRNFGKHPTIMTKGRTNRRYSPSIQVPRHTVEAARASKFAFHTKKLKLVGGKEVVAAFRQNRLVQYVNDIYPEYHAPSVEGISDEEAKVIEKNRLDEPLPELPEGLPPKRKTALSTMNRKIREGNFQEDVWRVYEGACAVCGLQASVTESAHIVDVENEGIDDVRNGVQMCRNHHKAYDDGLFCIGPDYTVILNHSRIGRLREMRLDGGLDEFVKSLREGQKIRLPVMPQFNPNPAFLTEKCRLKGIQPTLL
jgi:putative restriction endonuclease